MRYIVLLFWLLVPLGLWGAINIWGAPHVALSYRFIDNGRPYDPRAPRVYISCDYLGVHGWHTTPALDGRCPWVRFLKVAS